MLESYSAISGESGAFIELVKMLMVLVIVFTSVIGTLAADRDGDGVPDIYNQLERLFCRKARARHKARAKERAKGTTEKKHE